MLKKLESYDRSEKFSNVAKSFWLYFCARKTKNTSQTRIKPEILSTSSPNPAQTRPEKPGSTYNSAVAVVIKSNSILLLFQQTYTSKLMRRSSQFLVEINKP